MHVAQDDPLRPLKLQLLKQLGAGAGRPSDLARLPDAAACLAAARVLCLRSDVVEAWGVNAESAAAVQSSLISPRNEAAALALLHAHADAIFGGDGGGSARRAQLADLSASYCERAGAPSAAAAGASQPAADPAAAALQAWLKARGMRTALAPSIFPSGLRGLAVAPHAAASAAAAPASQTQPPPVKRADLPAGAHVIELPASLLITYKSAKESSLGQALSRIPGLDDESLAVVWAMVERHDRDEDAAAAPFWAALPERFCTGGAVVWTITRLCVGL